MDKNIKETCMDIGRFSTLIKQQNRLKMIAITNFFFSRKGFVREVKSSKFGKEYAVCFWMKGIRYVRHSNALYRY